METKKAELVKKRAELEKQYSKLSNVLRQTAEAEPSLEEALKLGKLYNQETILYASDKNIYYVV